MGRTMVACKRLLQLFTIHATCVFVLDDVQVRLAIAPLSQSRKLTAFFLCSQWMSHDEMQL